MKTLESCAAGDAAIEYTLDEDSGRIGLAMCPTRLLDKRPSHRERLGGSVEIDYLPAHWAAPRAWHVHSLVQLALVGDWAAGGHAQGRTMLNNPATLDLRYQDQQIQDTPHGRRIITRLHSPRGFSCVHELSHDTGQQAVSTRVTFRNESPADLTLAMLGSFSLGQITPFVADDAPGRLRVHRFRSVWSAEGRLDTQTIEQLHLERSWMGHGAFCERFGQVGTMPVRGFFPFVAIEDSEQGVLWGAQLAWAGSWQMEVYRRDDFVLLAGGHWSFSYRSDDGGKTWQKLGVLPGTSNSHQYAAISQVTPVLFFPKKSLSAFYKYKKGPLDRFSPFQISDP
jgi:alpha-galactosidase